MTSGDRTGARHLRLLPGGSEPAEPDPRLPLRGRLPAPARPELRRSPRDEVAVFRLRAELEHSRPVIWRTVDVRSDVTLDRLHEVLQAAYGWYDGHLHRFSLGGGPFDRESQLFLCPYDVESGDDDGIPDSTVRLDEVVQEPGDQLEYVYDYGDDWGLRLTLVETRPAAPDSAWAVCVAGERAAPPEDCGGLTEAEDLAEVLDDPAAFDLAEVNAALGSAYAAFADVVDTDLVALVHRLRFSPVGSDLVNRLMDLATRGAETGVDEMRAALAAPLWFIERAAVTDGLELTAAGYLKPDDVVAAHAVVPAAHGWWGKNNREVNVAPLLEFREVLQSMGLLRKRKGRLLATKAAAAALENVSLLWRHLAGRLVPTGGSDFEREATLLLLVYAATAGPDEQPLKQAALALGLLGWRHGSRPIEHYTLYRLKACVLLTNVDFGRDGRRRSEERARFSEQASDLARTALRTI